MNLAAHHAMHDRTIVLSEFAYGVNTKLSNKHKKKVIIFKFLFKYVRVGQQFLSFFNFFYACFNAFQVHIISAYIKWS